MKPRIIAVLSLAAALFAGCARSDTERYRAEIIAADKAFSASSLRQGPKAAFLGAIAPDCKLLAADTRSGADAVNNVFMQLPATATLTWEPSYADVSAAGDLGYTWGRYELKIPLSSPGTAPLVRKGTYETIWKRQLGGAWKAVLDGGNPDGSH